MNFLAHAWLSFGHPGVLVGNLTADFIKGRQPEGLPHDIRLGIDLHRQIDAFTDTHPATAAAKEFFRADYRLYSAPIVDVVYDHFLANDTSVFTPGSLLGFTQQVYGTLAEHADWLPARFLAVFPHMRTHNWLYNYRERWGMQRSLEGLVRRASQMPPAEAALDILDKRHDELRACYAELAPDVKEFAKNKLQPYLR